MPGSVQERLRQVEALDAFVRLVDEVDRDADREAFYGSLAEAICGLSEIRRAVVFRYDPERRQVAPAGSHGIPLEQFAGVPVTIETLDLARQALLENRVVDAWPPFEGVPEPFVEIANVAPLVVVPICAAERMIGVVIGQREPHAPPMAEETRHWLWTLGKVAALAATARMTTWEQQRARSLEERIALARDIHDRVVQRLFGVSLALSSGGALAAAERRRCSEELQTALAELRDALRRPLGHELRPTKVTLSDEIERLRAASDGLSINVTGDPAAVPAALESLAQAVMHEAVVNAQRHATPDHINVRVGQEDGTFVLEVANDGVGNKRRPPGGLGMGLRLAAFSALRLGGLVEFGPRQAGWWQVRLVVPDVPEVQE